MTQATFLNGISGTSLLKFGLLISALGMVFGLFIYQKLRKMPVHSSMLEISELIYETCKTYMLTQGKFLMILEIFIGAAIVLASGVGVWGLFNNYELIGAVSLAVGVLLVIYFAYFAGRAQRI